VLGMSSWRLTSRRVPLLRSLLGATLVCFALFAVQMAVSGSTRYAFLAWNIVLAAVPLALALLAEIAAERRIRLLVPALAVLWLVFLPNAPYIVTDGFAHAGNDPPLPLWFDIVLFSAFASTGLGFGLVSVHMLKRLARRRLNARTVWALLAIALTASSFGIFLGRFVQLNSWDLLTQPLAVLQASFQQVSPAQAVEFTVGFTAFLFTAFVLFEALIGRRESAAADGTMAFEPRLRIPRSLPAHERSSSKPVVSSRDRRNRLDARDR
jgi:uncharacterized membrane protein